MLKSHEKFHSSNGKRKILVADDEFINRELLGNILQEDYEVLYACDGLKALKLLREYQDQLSLLLLDLLMPEMNGLDLLKLMKRDTELQRIPVIVLTSAHSAEVECLELGASDFIPKPYPQPEVILARVFRTIELSEDRDIIQSTERDNLTGLYNKEYFYRYAEQFDLHHKGLAMDAIVLDVNHFHMINERYGKAYGDEVLRRIGEKVREMVRDSGGIVCRREADTFLVYCPHREDYKVIIENASIGLSGEENAVNRIRLRMGVYSNADKTIDIERRFDRAKLAADTVRSSYAKAIAEYDSTLHESELYAEQLLEDFHEAVEQKQFKVFYQPKFDIRPEIPVLTSAEALVRWEHPRLGMIRPDVFIPLFEDSGLIEQLDHYVWREAAAQIRDWEDRFGIPVSVSVNVSRIDMYNPELIRTLRQILEDYGLTTQEFLLEITESAYTENSGQIINMVNQLRELGFRIEMDDFGTGYSSLNMLSILPIDALKLDMQFIRNAFGERKDTRLLEAIIDIAGYFSVPVIAEGVETENQLLSLKAMGCDIVQGYYFSRPVPSEEYERFIIEKRNVPAYHNPEAARSTHHDDHTIPIGVSNGNERIRQAGDNAEPLGRHAADSYVDPAASAHMELTAQDTRETRETQQLKQEQKYESVQTNSVTYSRIAQALARDYFTIYYVNTETDQYSEYSSRGPNHALTLIRSGEEFFEDCKRRIPEVILPEDWERMTAAFDKNTLLPELENGKTFSIAYRLLSNGVPIYASLKALRLADDRSHIIIGISNIDAQMQKEQEYESARKQNVTYGSIAQALAADYFSIYYVDTETDHFIEYSSHDDYQELNIEKGGDDFFNLSLKNILRVVYPEDREKVSQAMIKENLLREMKKNGTFTLEYRLLFGDKPTYVSLKASRMQDNNDKHIVIGVNNIDAQMQRQKEYNAVRARSLTYSRIAQALSKDYYSIYYVNTETDEFVEYSSNSAYQELKVEQSGENFFEDCRRNILRLVYKDDLNKALSVWEKERLLPELEDGKSFSVTYRLMFDKEPVYINCKVIRMTDGVDDKHIVIGVSNVDEQMKREAELSEAKIKANRDALTGVKSKHAYVETEAELNRLIPLKKDLQFAVAVCDVNGLKAINDKLGHKAGDKYIKDASAIICNIFKHSPVFRIGGDEFVAILQGQDYENRSLLMTELAEKNQKGMQFGGVIIASGLSEYVAGKDSAVLSVFERADEAMYVNKKELKGIR